MCLTRGPEYNGRVISEAEDWGSGHAREGGVIFIPSSRTLTPLCQNLQGGKLVNGSVGKVVDFMTADEAAPPASSDGMEMMFDEDGNWMGGAPESSTKKGTQGDGIDIAQAALTDREKQKQQLSAGEMPSRRIPPGRWPVVEFTSGRKMLLPPMDFELQNADGVMEACRTAVPLILAYGLTIHKSQGQTLERVRVDLGDVFEAGQGYVALSRATQLASQA